MILPNILATVYNIDYGAVKIPDLSHDLIVLSKPDFMVQFESY